jgi:HlyD family secretion protein
LQRAGTKVKKLLVFLIVLGLLAAGAGYWFSQARSVQLNEDSFSYAAVEFGTMKDTVSATGALRPKEVVAVGSELSGKVVKLLADVNDVVEEGDPLFQLDDEMARLKVKQAEEDVQTAQAAIEAAKAQQEAAQNGLNMQLELQKSGSGFRTEAERYRSQVKAAKAAVKAAEMKKVEAQTTAQLAQLGLQKTLVKVPKVSEIPSSYASRGPLHAVSAPSAGQGKRRYRVIDRKMVLGQMVAPPASAELFTLATDLADMQVHAQVAESDIAKVRKGLKATFTVSAYTETERTFRGEVVQRRPMPANQQGAVFYDTVIDTANAIDPATREWRLLPGMTAAVDIILREHQTVWKVPTTALTFQLDEHYQSAEAKAKLAGWQKHKDAGDWKALWVWDRSRKSAWPIFIRIGGTKKGETGIKDNQFNEILEWEPGQEPKSPHEAPNAIISAPAYRKPGLFEQPTHLKIS